MNFNHVTQEEREQLYEEVWADPLTTVAKRYNMSDNGLRKHCRKLWIPLPAAGYWAKVKAGQKLTRPDLPKVRGELKRYVHQYAIKYRKDIDELTDDELKAVDDLRLLTEDTIAFIHETCSKIQVKSQLRNPHTLITEHKEELVYRKKRDKALQQASFNTHYYNITKGKYRDNKAMLPINVSDVNLHRAYRILDALISAIADMEGYARVGLESGKDKGDFVVMRSSLDFEMKEQKNKRSKSSNDEETPPILVLSMQSHNWYDRSIQFQLVFKDQGNKPLEDQVGKIIFEMFVVANKMLAAEELGHRQFEREREEEKRHYLLEQMRKGQLEELKLLEEAALDWDKAERIRRFTDTMEAKISAVTDERKREKLIRWLQWARNKADWLDPLTYKEDELLGKSRHIFDIISDINSNN